MTRGRWIALIAVEIIALCCCAGIGLLVYAGNLFDTPSSPTTITLATLAPVRATPTFSTTSAAVQPRTAASTSTVPPALGTPPSTLYNVVIPTPTAARIVYPVDFVDTFVLVTYPVGGSSLSTISKSLDANAMSDPHEPNSKYYARTDWYISYRTTSKISSRGCELDKSTITVAVTMTLPALTTTSIPRDVSDRWSSFIQKTIVHESGHVKLAQDGARALHRDLGNISPASTCDALDTRVKSLFNTSFSGIDRSNVQYDVDTRHGITQGAVFP